MGGEVTDGGGRSLAFRSILVTKMPKINIDLRANEEGQMESCEAAEATLNNIHSDSVVLGGQYFLHREIED